MVNANPAGRSAGIRSLEKGAQLLFALRDAGEPLRLVEVAERAAMSRSQAHGYLASLLRVGLAARDAASGRYSLGDASMQLGLVALGRTDLLRLGQESVRDLQRATGAECFLAVWSARGPVIVARAESAQDSIYEVRIGAVVGFLTSATGRQFLSRLPPARWRHLLPKGKGRPSQRQLAALRSAILADGLCSLDPVTMPGRGALSAPVNGWNGELRAVLTLVGPKRSFDNRVRGRNAPALRKAAAELSARLGHAAPKGAAPAT